MIPITEILKSDDPLSDTYFESLLNYSEEDALIDYKEQFNIDEEKDWFSITKDIMAFSNTIGGFLVFGVRDITFELIGIDDYTAKILGDANNILQKINRFIEPQITNLRSKKVSDQGKLFVFVYIPASKDITHMFSKDGSFKYPSGQEKCEFRKGTFIVRRSAGNHLADSRDLDFVFNNRLKSFRESILDRISKVVEAPSESKILIVSEEKDASGVQKYTIDDSPDAIRVKGMSFSIVPKTDEEELSGWVSLNKRDPRSIPHKNTLWEWYLKRESIKLNPIQQCAIAKFCILLDVPFFYWLKDCESEQIFSMLQEAIEYEGNYFHYNNIVLVANFLSKNKFNAVLRKLGKKIDRVSRSRKRYMKEDKLALVSMGKLGYRNSKHFNETDGQYRNRLSKELNDIAKSKINENPRISTDEFIEEAIAYDCYLYSNKFNYNK